MTIQSLTEIDDGQRLEADLVIVGAGACGLTLARALSGSGLKVLVLESGGIGEDDDAEALNAVELVEGSFSEAEAAHGDSYHRNLTTHWDGARQSYGVRCRGLGGSTQAWAGKSAPFEPLDLAERRWVPLSGWPLPYSEVSDYFDRAADLLNLGPGSYDGALWDEIGRHPPTPSLAESGLRSVFWKFARSRRKANDIMRFGADLAADPPPDIRVIIDATVSKVMTTPDGRKTSGVALRSRSGKAIKVAAAQVVLAASTIENARLLLLSRDADPRGLGNAYDCVGRYLTDHPTATVARFGADEAAKIAARFGLYGHRADGHTRVYMHGLALSEDWQRANKGLNGAVFVSEERAPDDPFSALKRLMKGRSTAVLKDLASVARSPMRLARGAMSRAIERGYIWAPLSGLIVDIALRLFPNNVAQEFQNGNLPLKLVGVRVEATTEQPPLAENRVTLSDRRDAFGLELPRVHWQAGAAARKNLMRIGQQFDTAFRGTGLPTPRLEDWVADRRPAQAVAIDLGHSMGTTRMSASPETGVVDPDCQVHGVDGLYITGGSVLPTSGHANPTLTMIALTLRLADHLKARRA